MELERELSRLVGALAEAKVDYSLIGGLALAVYGRPRATRDIDFLIQATDWDRVRQAVAPLGFQHATTPIRMADGRLEFRRLTRLEGAEYLVADFLLLAGPDEALTARRQLSWQGKPLSVAEPRAIIALKRLRGSPQDLADIAVLEELDP